MESTWRATDDAAAELRRTTRLGLAALVGIAFTVIAILVVGYSGSSRSAQTRRAEWAAILVVGLGIGVALLTMYRLHRDLSTEARFIDRQRDALERRTTEFEIRTTDAHSYTREIEQRNVDLAASLGDAQLARRSAERVARQKARVASVLETVLDNAPVGFAFLDDQLRFLRVNETLARYNNLAPEDHVGLALPELDRELGECIEPILNRVLRTRQPVVNIALTCAPVRRPGEHCRWLTSYYPIATPEGEAIGLGLFVVDVTDQTQAESLD
jgi:PAS domain-containing protein